MFTWEDQVAKDSWLGEHRPHAGLIVMLLRKKMNHDGETGPIDRRWISRQIGCSVRTVQRSLNALVGRNHVEIISGKSTGVGNRYRAKVKGTSNVQPVGWDTRVPGGGTLESQGVCHQSPTRIHDSSFSSSGRHATNGTGGARGRAAGFQGKQGPWQRPKTDAAVAERVVSNRLGPEGDQILGTLQETEEGRCLYDRLVATAQVGGVARHLLEEARRHYMEFTGRQRRVQGGV
jgi:hypothetical protein